MSGIENVTRRSAVYWWRRGLRLAPASANSITVVTMVSLLTKGQPVARRRAVAMTGRSETVRMSLYEKLERDGLTADQTSAVFQEEMFYYRKMLAYQRQSIQQDGEGHVAERFAQMRAIYGAVNRDFADNGFGVFWGSTMSAASTAALPTWTTKRAGTFTRCSAEPPACRSIC